MSAPDEPPRTEAPRARAGVDDAARRTALAAARRRASLLLVAVAIGFVASLQLPDTTWAGYLVAALEAGLVGGLADWFAVVALFRHPLGLPIPHTAVVPRSKDGFGNNLGRFVGDNFLEPDRVTAELADPVRVDRVGAWLADPDNADRVAQGALVLVSSLARAVDPAVVVREGTAVARRRLRDLPLARLAGEAVDGALARGTHRALVDALVEGVLEAVRTNRATLRRELGRHSPAWVPAALDDVVFDRAHDVLSGVLRTIVSTRDHPLRGVLDHQLAGLAGRLRSDPALDDRIESSVEAAIDDALLARWVGAAWDAVVRGLDAGAAAAGPADDDLRRLASVALRQLGTGLQREGRHHDRAVALLAEAAPGVAEVAGREVVGLVTRTVDQWDPEVTADRLELWLGPELQWVRINGTLVGALVGLVLHAVTQVV